MEINIKKEFEWNASELHRVLLDFYGGVPNYEN